MSKYVRTKDGIYYVPSLRYQNAEKCKCEHGLIIKRADTIEELCDGFWWENTMYTEPIFIPNFGLVLDRVKAWKESDKELNDNSFDRITIYGSIYIDFDKKLFQLQGTSNEWCNKVPFSDYGKTIALTREELDK